MLPTPPGRVMVAPSLDTLRAIGPTWAEEDTDEIRHEVVATECSHGLRTRTRRLAVGDHAAAHRYVGSPNGIVELPADVPDGSGKSSSSTRNSSRPTASRFTSWPRDGWSDHRILKARNVMQHVLTDVPGTRFGADKSVIANSMADRKATMVLFNTEPDLREAFENTDLGEADLSMQDLRANECPVEGDDDYMAHRTRDASFEENITLCTLS